MSRIVPGLVLSVLVFLGACRKTDNLADQPLPPTNPVFQPANPCSIKEDASRTLAAMQRFQANRTMELQTPVVLLLDFNGHKLQNTVWNPETVINCPAVPATMLSKEMKDYIVASVTEDFSGFLVTVTKSEQEYLAAAPERRMRCVITHKMTGQFGNVGGTAFIGSMLWGDNTPCFVFCDPLLYNEKYIAGAVSHELGHTFGLQHQARYDSGCSLQEEYHSGEGEGQLSWAPIMGLSYYKSLVTWHEGYSVLGCDQLQNDMNMLHTVAGEKADDHGSALNNTATLLPSAGTKKGILGDAGDMDAFRKNDVGAKRITITPGGNSDLALEVYKLNGQLEAVYNDAACTHIDVVLSGKRYLRVKIASGQPFVPGNDGFGGYKINVSVP